MKIYISGPITGKPDENRPAFHSAALILGEKGHAPVIPHDLHPNAHETWEQYLRKDIAEMLACDAVLMLDGWASSRGAYFERDVARKVKIPIYHLTKRGEMVNESTGCATRWN